MIIDKETNFVYFSSLIKSVEKYTPFWARLKRVLVEKATFEKKNKLRWNFYLDAQLP